MKTIHKHLNPEDFVIIVRPVKEDEPISEEVWTGDVQVSIIANSTETPLTQDEFNNMILLCNCAAASIPAMEENTFIRDIIHSYAQKNMIMPMPDEDILYNSLLTFDSDTEGNA
tara:strand:+ start:226 stop:567 length:342 start_codon:yes stop_codon:yes gene_type:complete